MATSAQVSTTVTIPSRQASISPPHSPTSSQPRPQQLSSSSGYLSSGPLNRPWWRPPARNYRPHPANRVISSTYSPNPIPIPVGPRESLPHYWLRALSYILRIPFREMVGNVTRPYDPTVPQPMADIPMSISPPSTRPSSPPSTIGGTGDGVSGTGTASSGTEARGGRAFLSGLWPTSTQTQPEYMPQIRKAWAERTGDISMALMAAFFSSATVTVAAIVALTLNWSKECTYLKVYMVVFVVRKWIMTALMIDRALYRLPLNLVECDPDIDEERYNGIAIYMSDLFTWHGYAMLFAGSFYVYGYATVHYLTSAPAITGVAIVFASMGLVPFFTLLALVFVALSCLYVLYILFICFVWPFEKCGLSRRRAISRRNGGYRSDGTTNTTDLAQLEGSGNSSVIGFGNSDHIKITPAMAAIPIVVFRKPIKSAPSEKEDLSTGWQVVEKMVDMPTINMGSASKGATYSESQTDAINNMPTSLSRLCDSITGSMASSTSSLSMPAAASCVRLPPPNAMFSQQGSKASSTTSFVPCASGSEEETEKHQRQSSVSTTTRTTSKDKQKRRSQYLNQSISSQGDHIVIDMGSNNMGVGRISDHPEIDIPKPERRGSSGFSVILPHYMTTAPTLPPVSSGTSSPLSLSPTPQSTSRPPSPWVPAITATAIAASGSCSAPIQSDNIEVAPPTSETYPQVWETNFDDECAICLYEFDDGDELRHLYCNHYFHRNCVDRWLVKNPFCPKCKRAI
ncbi:hypothetical protein CPB97_010397 [Podila verticillata]|nr:hypothetical protein CPB97_010397 [Podila verticillata]